MNESFVTHDELNDVKAEILSQLSSILKQPKKSNLDLLKSADVRSLLKCSESTLDRLKKSGKLPFVRIMRTIYFKRDDVEALLENENEGD